MPKPARDQWWDDVVSVDSVKLNNSTYLLWGDRVQVLERDETKKQVKVFARSSRGWIPESALGGEPLLEVYFIDVGQGDGILVVTPEGHHLVLDGGDRRGSQQTGKNAADFIDWKFHRDYLQKSEHGAVNDEVRLDAMIVTHADTDHYGGLQDLIDRRREKDTDELQTRGVSVEAFYHPGLCPQTSGPEDLGSKTADGHYFNVLLEDRASAEDGVRDEPTGSLAIRGLYKKFIEAVLAQTTADGTPTPITRLSQALEFLPGFEANGDSKVTIEVLAPIELKEHNGRPLLRDLGNEAVNKNGHSVALRLNYGKRRIVLTGDLNEKSHKLILDHYGEDFATRWGADVVKACHHGSHDIDFRFLQGIGALSTVFSSGDANTYDHPRAWVLGGAALAGRVIVDGHRLKAPLVYSTEVARSCSFKKIDQLRRYGDAQQWGPEQEKPVETVSGEKTMQKWRVVLDRKSKSSDAQQPVSAARVLHDVIYGLVNVRTDGKRLLFAVRNEGDHSWSFETIEEADIDAAIQFGAPA